MVKFSKNEREEFNKSRKEVLDNSIENINKKRQKKEERNCITQWEIPIQKQ